jgi:hypothetical protein
MRIDLEIRGKLSINWNSRIGSDAEGQDRDHNRDETWGAP